MGAVIMGLRLTRTTPALGESGVDPCQISALVNTEPKVQRGVFLVSAASAGLPPDLLGPALVLVLVISV